MCYTLSKAKLIQRIASDLISYSRDIDNVISNSNEYWFLKAKEFKKLKGHTLTIKENAASIADKFGFDNLKELVALANKSLTKAINQLALISRISNQTTYEEIVALIESANTQVTAAKGILDSFDNN